VTSANFYHAVNVCKILALVLAEIVANRHGYVISGFHGSFVEPSSFLQCDAVVPCSVSQHFEEG
jgi:hypothetical protein